jgi:hypothetical protein
VEQCTFPFHCCSLQSIVFVHICIDFIIQFCYNIPRLKKHTRSRRQFIERVTMNESQNPLDMPYEEIEFPNPIQIKIPKVFLEFFFPNLEANQVKRISVCNWPCI